MNYTFTKLPLSVIFLGITFCHCSQNKPQEKAVVIAAPLTTLIKEDTAITHGLTIDLEYEKYPREQLKPIIEKFLRINATNNWESIKKVDLYQSTEGGEATFYFKDKKLQKVISKNYGETGKEIKEYYLNNDSLMFVYEATYKYNRPMYFDSLKMQEMKDTAAFDMDETAMVEQRSYFIKAALVHQSNNQDCGAPFAESYLREEQKRITDELAALLKRLK